MRSYIYGNISVHTVQANIGTVCGTQMCVKLKYLSLLSISFVHLLEEVLDNWKVDVCAFI